MTFDDLIRFKALHLKFIASGSNVVELLAEGKVEHNVSMKNVCAMITQELFDDLTSTCGLLDISKRTFIEAAIVEALTEARSIMEQEGLLEYLAERSKEGV